MGSISTPAKRLKASSSQNDSIVTPFKSSDTSQVTPATDTTASRDNCSTQVEESQHYIITQDDPNDEKNQLEHTILSSSPLASSQEISLNSDNTIENRSYGNRCKTW